MGQFGINRCPLLDNFGKKGGGLPVLTPALTAVPSCETALYIIIYGRWQDVRPLKNYSMKEICKHLRAEFHG
jgi:hypothetical protein